MQPCLFNTHKVQSLCSHVFPVLVQFSLLGDHPGDKCCKFVTPACGCASIPWDVSQLLLPPGYVPPMDVHLPQARAPVPPAACGHEVSESLPEDPFKQETLSKGSAGSSATASPPPPPQPQPEEDQLVIQQWAAQTA